MTPSPLKQDRVLAIVPSSRGFGFAVLEDEEQLVGWGIKRIDREKNSKCLTKVNELVTHYDPALLVLQDYLDKNFRRCDRIKALCEQLVELSSGKKVKVKLITQEQVRRVFFADRQGTKQGIAEMLAEQFPNELGSRLPPKRKAWMSEDSRMALFEAVALVMTSCLVK